MITRPTTGGCWDHVWTQTTIPKWGGGGCEFRLGFWIWIRVKAMIYYIEISGNMFYTSKFWLHPQSRVSIVTATQR